MREHEWQTIIEPRTEAGAPPGVRRLRVPGGWLYQVESHEILAGTRVVTRVWQPPVLVPAAPDVRRLPEEYAQEQTE